jgi:hypothetical protein
MRRASLLVNALAAIVALALVLAGAPGRAAQGPHFDLVNAAGALQLSNSKAGQAILGGAELRPGDTVAGSVTIANTGAVGARFALDAAVEAQTGLMAQALYLTVTDITAPSAPVPVYDGPLATMPRQTFRDALAPGAARTFQFAATLPHHPLDDNVYQGARLSIGFTWSAEAVETPTPSPTPSPTPIPPTATPTPPSANKPNPTPPAVSPEQVFTLPSSKRCVSRRKLKIKVRRARGVAVVQTTVFVGKRKVATKRGKTAVINLKGLPKGTFRVKVVAKLSDGRQLVLKRTYRTCTKKRARR